MSYCSCLRSPCPEALLLPLPRHPVCSWETPFPPVGTRECESSKQRKSLLFLPSPGRGYPMGNRVLPLLTKTEMEESRKLCFPASEMRLCAPSVSGITFRNIVLLPYLSRREQLLIPPPQKSLWLVSTFTGCFFYFCHMQNIY